MRAADMTRYFCTSFDSNYLARGLAMSRSLARHCPGAVIFALALDDYCYDFLTKLEDHPHLRPIRLADLEKADHELFVTAGSRSRAEYIFTIKPCLVLYLIKLYSNLDMVTYIDADLYFFSSPEPIFEELGSGNVAIIPHRFAPNLRYMAETRGFYNAGWFSIVNNLEGRKCLDWFRERCLEWCYDRVEEGRYADQKYLESFAGVAEGVVAIKHPGGNVASWNLGNGGLKLSDGEIYVEDARLIFFHYQGVKRCLGRYYDCGLFSCRLRLSLAMREAIFCTYIKAVLATKNEYSLDLPDFTYGFRYKSKFPLLANAGRTIFDMVKISLGFCVSC